MLRLEHFAPFARALRQDDPEELGIPTLRLLSAALAAGRIDEAERLAGYALVEAKGLHDVYNDWIWDLLTQVARRSGEDEMAAVLRGSQETWMIRRTWRALLKLPVLARVQLTAETLRAHLGGPDSDGEITVSDEGEYWRIVMDPCGSGGRMRRGPHSRLAPPYGFGRTQQAHPWSWGRTEVPYYCCHCAFNELLPMEWGGHPLWVTDYDPDAARPCMVRFYKRAEDIPEHYYTRVGRSKPGPGEGQY